MAGMGNGENERVHGRGAGGGVMPMTTASHVVQCGQCQRTRVVAVSNLHPPCFRNIEEQADCPEILQRRGSGDETLLTMMCGALAGSFAQNLERAVVDVVDRQGVWQVACRIPGDPDRFYSSGQARWQAKIWSVARASEGWRDYCAGGSCGPYGATNNITQRHMDHVHVSLNM